MNKEFAKYTVHALGLLLYNKKLQSVTVFCSPLQNVKQRVRVTRIEPGDFRVRVGTPNYRERQWLKLCRKAKCLPRRVKEWPIPKKRG